MLPVEADPWPLDSKAGLLKALRLSYYHDFRELPNSIGELWCLKELNLCESSIAKLPESVSGLSGLETLILSGCRNLTELPNSIGELGHLQRLELPRTSIRTLPESISALSNLMKLNMAYCVSLQSLPYSIGELSHLKELNLCGSSIAKLTESVSGLSGLETLILSGCRNLTELPNSIGKLGHLRELDLSHTSIPTLPESLSDLSNLKVLRLDNCVSLEALPDSIENLLRLKVLNVSGSSIQKLPESIIRLPGLETLVLSSGRNVELPISVLGLCHNRSHSSIRNFLRRRKSLSSYNHYPSSIPNFPEIRPRLKPPNVNHGLEPQSPPDDTNLAINSDDDAEALRAADHKDASAAEILGVADDQIEALSDQDTFVTHGFDSRSPPVEANLPTNSYAAAETPRSADVPKDANLLVHSGGASEILGVVDHNDDPTDSLSDQDTFDFFPSFETLKVSDVSQLRELPRRLRSLRIVECHFLESLAAELVNEGLNLSELYMIDCGSLKDFVDESYCTSLTTLYIHKCRKLEFPLPLVTTRNFACLKHLNIDNSCDSLEFFTLNLFPKLKTLCIWDCPHLKSLSISEGFQNDNLKLESLEIRDCLNLASFPAQGLPAPNLKSIRFSNCKNLTSLPNDMASLASLQFIFLDRCPELESFPAGGLPSTLNLLSIAFCDKLIPQKEWELQRLHSLSRFEIESGCMGMKSFPDKDLLPRNLISLRISKLLSLTSLDYMGLQDLTSLESLEINSCRKLYSFPDEGFPSSLSFLCIKECPMLTQKLLYKAGAEWWKIARIPSIQVNNNLISSNRTGGSSISGNGII